MREDFLHYLWRLQRFDRTDLRTTEGDLLEIQQRGTMNTHAGPDFSDARVRIGNTRWAGNVEIHVRSAEWRRHRHQEDAAYDSVILHVVHTDDAPVYHRSGARIPTLELKGRIPLELHRRYRRLIDNESWIPCAPLFPEVPALTRNLWLDRLLVERLERKTARIDDLLHQTQGDWEATAYRFLLRNIGLRVNTEAFALLAQTTPLAVLRKQQHSLEALEALLFGQSGLLRDAPADAYTERLRETYRHLRSKYGLTAMPVAAWKFLRLRPPNFPTLRIAQTAALLHARLPLFQSLLTLDTAKAGEAFFHVAPSSYWETHYKFGEAGNAQAKPIGAATARLLLINAVVPLLFAYGKRRGNEAYYERALQLLEALPAERNAILRHWKALGVPVKSAHRSQALLQLKNEYCTPKRCLECAIGHAVLKRGREADQ